MLRQASDGVDNYSRDEARSVGVVRSLLVPGCAGSGADRSPSCCVVGDCAGCGASVPDLSLMLVISLRSLPVSASGKRRVASRPGGVSLVALAQNSEERRQGRTKEQSVQERQKAVGRQRPALQPAGPVK